MLRNIDVAFAAALRVLSWILGLLDTVYVHLSIRRRTGRFFEDGYGDLAEELRLQTHIRGLLPHLPQQNLYIRLVVRFHCISRLDLMH